ncbi:MAG: DUF454 domain-containing protein [Bacteroidia bacterium]|nr:DUF454 domain-containing protein [Bacteroidia bacterium]
MMKKYVYMFFGTISLCLGIIGIALPVLPTTPFLLLTAWLYFRSSPKLYQKLMNSKYFGTYIKSFREDKAIPLHAKIISISLLWITISYSAICILEELWLRILLFTIAIAVSIHILSFKTK